jgi:hypothetical protein
MTWKLFWVYIKVYQQLYIINLPNLLTFKAVVVGQAIATVNRNTFVPKSPLAPFFAALICMHCFYRCWMELLIIIQYYKLNYLLILQLTTNSYYVYRCWIAINYSILQVNY